MSDLKF